MKTTNSASDLVPLYIKKVVRLHVVPKSIVSDRDSKFLSNFWKSLHSALGTGLDLSTTFRPQTDGQSEHAIQTLEDLLRSYVLSWKGSWEDHLPWQSLLIIIVIKLVSKWLHMKHCMAVGVFPHFVGMSLVRGL
jgi:hypothetical protein